MKCNATLLMLLLAVGGILVKRGVALCKPLYTYLSIIENFLTIKEMLPILREPENQDPA